MHASRPADIVALEDALEAADRDARAIVAGLTEEQGAWRAAPGSWSVAECLDHLATANRVYLGAMQPAAERALEQGRRRRGPAQPGFIGRWFVGTLEPPAKTYSKLKAPRKIVPRTAPALADAVRAFLASQEDVRTFLRKIRRHRSRRRALSESLCPRRAVQPGHGAARRGRARPASPVAGLECATRGGTRGSRVAGQAWFTVPSSSLALGGDHELVLDAERAWDLAGAEAGDRSIELRIHDAEQQRAPVLHDDVNRIRAERLHAGIAA